MARNQKDFTLDVQNILKDAGLVASTAAATVGGSARVLDLGAGRTDGIVVVDITACEVADGNESYTIQWQLSSSPTFASDIVSAAALQVGDSSVTGSSVDTPASAADPTRMELGITNEVNGVIRRYGRLRTVVAGTVATGINYTAFLAKDE